ncbi:MAG TPA: cytochrome c peroxidase [Gemmataceae bacterium]|nr:cytochrome c peroxidase [Gemmataceae bacterium]
MSRRALSAGLAAAFAATALAADAPPAVPRDTLPARLALDEVPLGLADRLVPKESPLTEARVRLGRRLFFDPVLSADNSVACASCHEPEHGFAGREARSRGIGGRRTERRAPTLLNRAYGTTFFWDGREATLEEQALRPIENPSEMGSTVAAALERLRASKDYREQFDAAFADGATPANLGRALASFERVLLRGDSPVDRFRRQGKHDALNAQQRHGLWLYESKGRCWRCHTGGNFSDERFHNTGVSWGKEPIDPGRHAVTKKDEDRGKFKTPTLRGVALTGPYMHDGSIETLEEVVEFYNRGGTANPNLDPAVGALDLSKEEVRDLVAFLKAL